MLSTPGGQSVTVLVNVTPIHASGGAVESVVVTVQDLAPLQALERQRAEFLDMVSHELRAPLSAIKGSATTLVEAASSLDRAEMRAFSRIIVEHADHMRALISDLLDAGRIDSGTLSVAPEPTAVAALVDRARNTFLSGGGGHDVLIDLAPDLPAVMADRRRIVQVLNNLLANAARHSRERSPIRIEASRARSHVAIAVQDEGRGIASEQLAHLFRKHARIGVDDAERGVGSGLGLAISKGLVEAHGGRIRRRERRSRPGGALHLHAPRCRAGPGPSAGGRPRQGGHTLRAGRGAAAHPGRGRRPAGVALRSRRACRCGVRRAGERATTTTCPPSSTPSGPISCCST